MYQKSDLKNLYDRLKRQYPRYGLDFSGDRLTMTRLHSKVEVDREGVKLYVNGELYDQFTSGDVDDPDDLYELIEAFLLDLQHDGMRRGNATYLAAAKQATRMGRRVLILTAVCLTAVMIALLVSHGPCLILPVFLIPALSLVILKRVRRQVFQKYWVCPSCGQPLPMGGKGRSSEMEYVPQCPHCGKVLEQAPELEPIQREYSAPQQPLEPACDLPAPGSKWPCMISGGITIAFVLFLLPLIFIPDGNEPLDMAGVWTGVVLLLILLGFGLILLFCRHKEPEEMQQPIVIVRERKIVAVFGSIQWVLSLVMMLTAVIVAGTPPFDAGSTFVCTLIGIPFMLLGVWMLLAGRNRTLFVFQDNSMWYISSWGRRRELAPGQVASVRLTANRSIHLLNKEGKKLASIETNMRGIPRFAEWLESTGLAATMTPAMEKQARQEEQQESTVQWREEYRTRWHDHIKGIRVGLWVVMLLFATGVIAPIPLYLLGVKFTTIMKIGALAPIPFVVFCLVFAPVLLFGDHPTNATPEWNAMHIKVPLIPALLIGLIYIWQVNHIWDGFVLQEADLGLGWLVRVLAIGTVLTVLLILRTPKRLRLGAGLFMGLVGITIASGLHYCANAALSGPARHYPAVIVDSHADDPDVEDDDYELTIVLDNGKEAELAVPEKIYEMAMNGEPLDVCHRESPFGVTLLDVHAPEKQTFWK
ncbi:MAG: hypothetical protein KH440_12575 [Oscillospiraceae bacterium]|jgi:hypothetical protein|nr:hypothetical protein [Oscillospiraceae bacterium]